MSRPASSDSEVAGERPAVDADTDELDRADLLAQVEALRTENERLRAAYREAQRQRYRRTAGGFGLVGLAALVGAALFPGVRTVLLALGGTGLFAAVMTLYLTPESFVPASLGEAVAGTYSENVAAIAADLGLSDQRVYLPTEDDTRLYLPQHTDFDQPDTDALSTSFVTTENERARGLSLTPIGQRLYEQFADAHSGPVPDRPGPLAQALADAAVEQFELADTVTPETDAGRLAVGVSGARITPLSTLDHPLASLFGVALARHLRTGIDVSTESPDDERYDTLLVYSWDAEAVASSEFSNASDE